MNDFPKHCAKILLVSENSVSSDKLIALLSEENHIVSATGSYSNALSLLKSEIFDIVLLSIALKDGSGYALCRYIKENLNVPVIFISAYGSENNVVAAFDTGADDFIPIPFRTREAISRINNALRKNMSSSTILTHKDIKVDTVKGQVTKNGVEIYLSSLEYRILLVFMSNKGKVLTREKLLESIWAVDGSYINDNTLTVYIKRIREKLEDKPSSPQFIKTIRGKGYKAGE